MGADVFPSPIIKEKHTGLFKYKIMIGCTKLHQLDLAFQNNPEYTFVNCSEEQNK